MKVSAIIPAYNAGPFLDETLRCVFAQTRLPDEVVVINDGSTDDTEAICRRWEGRIVYRRQENLGVSAARNVGAEVATGSHFIFIDADDCLLPQGVETLVAAGAPQPDAVVYGCTQFGLDRPDSRAANPKAAGPPPAGARVCFWRSAITTPGAALVSARIFREAGGFPLGREGAEDRVLWMKCGALTDFIFCEQTIIAKRIVEGSVSHQRDRNLVYYMLAQIEYLDWCRDRGIDPSFLQTSPIQIFDNSLQTAAAEGCWPAAMQMLEYARSRGWRSMRQQRVAFYTVWPVTFRRLFSRFEATLKAMSHRRRVAKA